MARPPDSEPPAPKPLGRRPAAVTQLATPAFDKAPDWLYHHLTISGPANTVETFAAAARGAGVIPWQLNDTAVADTVFVLAVSQPAADRNLTVAGCRILARQFSDAVAARQARAHALVGQSLACPFDLYTLLPVPAAILPLGPTHPDALAWLTAHWGTTDGLRQVVRRAKVSTGRRLKTGHSVIGYGFFTRGDTPHAAIAQIAGQYKALRFVLVPRPAD